DLGARLAGAGAVVRSERRRPRRLRVDSGATVGPPLGPAECDRDNPGLGSTHGRHRGARDPVPEPLHARANGSHHALPLLPVLPAGHRGPARESSDVPGGGNAMKPTPLVFVPGLVRRRQYRLLALTVGWILLWGVVLPALASDRVLSLYGDGWIRGLR